MNQFGTTIEEDSDNSNALNFVQEVKLWESQTEGGETWAMLIMILADYSVLVYSDMARYLSTVE